MTRNAAVHKPLESTSTLNRLPHLADSLLHFNLSDELRACAKRTHGRAEADAAPRHLRSTRISELCSY